MTHIIPPPPLFAAQAQSVKDAPRLSAQCKAILKRLVDGPCTNAELVTVALNYRARISDLRNLGHTIRCEHLDGGLTRYTLEVKT